MQSHMEVEQIITRTRQYEFSDGLREMQLALMWIGYGVMSWVTFDLMSVWFPVVLRLRARFGPIAGLSSLVFTLIPVLVVAAALGVMNLVRRRWLWRKTGMVKANRIVVPRRVNVIGVVIMLVGLGIGFALMQMRLVDDWFMLKALLATSGASFGYTMVAMGQYLQMPRYTPIGWIGGALSLVVLVIPVTIGQFGLILGGGWGIILIAGGIAPLRDAIRAARETDTASAGEEAADDGRD